MSSNYFTIDVEDWFHILDLPIAPNVSDWDRLDSIVVDAHIKLLDKLDEHSIKATCFFLGWIAQKYPSLVIETLKRGHEIASHGFSHQLVFTQTREQFFNDILRSKKVLEDISGVAVHGYRAPGFSYTSKSPWFYEELYKAGYTFDSSVFPIKSSHGGLLVSERNPYLVKQSGYELVEFPVTVTKLAGFPVCLFGGGYLRLFPNWLILRESIKLNRKNQSIVFYIHPREIFVDHPRMPMPLLRRFKSYVNLNSVDFKLTSILSTLNFTQMGVASREILKTGLTSRN